MTGASYLLDRWHIGEGVWPAIFNRPTDYDLAVKRHVEMFMESRGAVVVLTESTTDEVSKRFEQAMKAGRKEPLDRSQIRGALSDFRGEAHDGPLRVLPYDYGLQDKVQFAEHVVSAAQEAERGVVHLHEITTEWIGHPKPDVLLVAERPGNGTGKQPPSAEVPLPPFRQASGHALFSSMPRGKVAVVNAFQKDGAPTFLRSFWYLLGSPQVVALGNVAHRQLNDKGIPHGTVPHPQYVRRFWAERVGERYRTDIERAAEGDDLRGQYRNPGGKSK